MIRSDDWLKSSRDRLATASIETARLDCLVLLEDATGKDRGWLLAHPEFELSEAVLAVLQAQIERRAGHVPLAYIRGKAEFYGRDFTVDEQVLVPRPESEAMIETLKSLDLMPGSCVADVGTGSGCLGVTAALELPDLFVQAVDIDPDCLEIAEANANRLGADVHFYESDLLSEVSSCDVLLCNLPYVPDDYRINTAATHEPKLALFAGPDGLDLYRKLFNQITLNTWQPTFVLTESLPASHPILTQIAGAANYSLTATTDFIQLFTSKHNN